MFAARLAAAVLLSLTTACGGSNQGAVGVSNGTPARGTTVQSASTNAAKEPPWPMARDYRTTMKRVKNGEVSRGHDPGHFTYDLYRAQDDAGDALVMDHFRLDNRELGFVYVMKRAKGQSAWTFSALVPGPGEHDKALPARPNVLKVGEDGTCLHCHSEAPHDGLFTQSP